MTSRLYIDNHLYERARRPWPLVLGPEYPGRTLGLLELKTPNPAIAQGLVPPEDCTVCFSACYALLSSGTCGLFVVYAYRASWLYGLAKKCPAPLARHRACGLDGIVDSLQKYK